MLEEIAQRTSVLGLATEGYCFHFLYRKLLIGEARYRKRSASFAAVDWLALTVGDLKYLSADANEHLDAFDANASAGALSHFFFGRVDWPLLLSCFACLCHDKKAVGDEAELVASDDMLSFATSWRHENGIPPHPTLLLADYRDRHSKKVPRRSKKRLAGLHQLRRGHSKKRPAGLHQLRCGDSG